MGEAGSPMCRCGHTAHWHSFGGEGGCEANAECTCTRFDAAPVRARRYIAVIQSPDGFPGPGAPMEPAPAVASMLLSVVKADDYEALERGAREIWQALRAIERESVDPEDEPLRVAARAALESFPAPAEWTA